MVGSRDNLTLSATIRTFLKLKKLYDEDASQMICPAHHGAPPPQLAWKRSQARI